jgi:hypothetical protein
MYIFASLSFTYRRVSENIALLFDSQKYHNKIYDGFFYNPVSNAIILSDVR